MKYIQFLTGKWTKNIKLVPLYHHVQTLFLYGKTEYGKTHSLVTLLSTVVNCVQTQKANQPIRQHQLNAFRYVDMVKTTVAEVQSQHQKRRREDLSDFEHGTDVGAIDEVITWQSALIYWDFPHRSRLRGRRYPPVGFLTVRHLEHGFIFHLHNHHKISQQGMKLLAEYKIKQRVSHLLWVVGCFFLLIHTSYLPE